MDVYLIPHKLHVSVLVFSLKCTSVTLNTKKQAIYGHVQISQSNNHVFICLSSLMISNQSSKFNKILKDNKNTCESSINQRYHCKPNIFIFFFLFLNFLIWFDFIYINESKWFLNYSTRSNTKFISQSNKQSILSPT